MATIYSKCFIIRFEIFLTIREQEYDRQSGFVGKYICKNNYKLTDKEFEKIFNEALSKK